MTYSIRATSAVILALSLSACATIVDTPHKSSPATPEVSTPSAQGQVIQKRADPTRDGPQQHSTNDRAKAKSQSKSQSENLLYGTMTKYELMTFLDAIRKANMQGALESEEILTIFAPNNQAFEFSPLSKTADTAKILKGHMVSGALDIAALKAAVKSNGAPVSIMSKAGTELTIYVVNDTVKVSGPGGILATVTQSDLIQSNGVIHQINSVLSPQ